MARARMALYWGSGTGWVGCGDGRVDGSGRDDDVNGYGDGDYGDGNGKGDGRGVQRTISLERRRDRTTKKQRRMSNEE